MAAVGKYGWTPLHAAGCQGKAAAVRTLLDAGADVATVNKYGRTALHEAGWSESASTVQTLLDAGADVAAVDEVGCTAMHNAARARSRGALVALYGAGASLAARDSRGRTPLHIAAEGGRPAIVAALLLCLRKAQGAQDRGDAPGLCLYIEASYHVAEPPTVSVDAADNDARTPVHYAASRSHAAVVSLLLGHGAHSVVMDHMGQTPLFAAASLGHRAIVDQLSADQPARAVSTPLHGAGKHGRVALFAKPQLRRYVNTADETRNTPLHIAASSMRATSVKALVSLGGDVHARNEDNDTPFHVAVAWLEGAVRDAESVCTRAAARKHVGRRLRRAAAGSLVPQGQAGGVEDVACVPWWVCNKLPDFRAMVLCFLTAGVRVGRVARWSTRQLCRHIARSADGFWAAAVCAPGPPGGGGAAGGRGRAAAGALAEAPGPHPLRVVWQRGSRPAAWKMCWSYKLLSTSTSLSHLQPPCTAGAKRSAGRDA